MPYKDKSKKAEWEQANRAIRNAKHNQRDQQQRKVDRLDRPFIGVDGEGITREDGSHDYIMLCASTGESIVNRNGLDFDTCVAFLLKLREDNPTGIFVGFGFGYDSNMILKSRGLEWIRYLLNRTPDDSGYEKSALGGYLYTDWKPHKSLMFKLNKGRAFLVYDVFGFFQSSFHKALVDNGIGDEEQLAEIEEMKKGRSTFQERDIDRILEYSILECKLLAQLMEKLRSLIAGLEDTDLKLRLPMNRWDGAGALAAQLLKFYGVKAHRYPVDKWQPEYEYNGERVPVALAAYYGGRFESLMLGTLPKTYSYDINSAYPEAMQYLPCLSNAEFVRVPGIGWQELRHSGLAMVKVSWELPGDTILCPFPFRDKAGHISYPINGSGWYWSLEVNEAIDRFGDAIEVEEAYRLTGTGYCTCENEPFAWIRELYNYRRELKKVGDARQMPLKLGYNSCYGKLAQGVGAAPFQDFIWAGLITSYTRAKILRAVYAEESERYVVQIATDGIEFTRPMPHLETGFDLGQWEHVVSEDVFVAGNGLMHYKSEKGYKQKVRGFGKGERIDWQALREAFEKEGVGCCIPVELNRFVGANLALQLTPEHANGLAFRWITQARQFTVRLRNRDMIVRWGTICVEPEGRMISKRNGRVWLTSPIGCREQESRPHRPKTYKGALMDGEQWAIMVAGELDND